jgi:hypothetical protein
VGATVLLSATSTFSHTLTFIVVLS